MATKGKRILGIFVVLLVLLVLLLAFLPAILSTGAARRFVVKKINQAVPGEVGIEDWSLSWKKALVIRGVTFREEGGGLDVDVASVSTDKGLWSLYKDNPDLGSIVVDRPNVVVGIPEAKEEEPPPPEPAPPPKQSGGGSKPSAPAQKKEAFTFPDLVGQVLVKDGRIGTRDAKGEDTGVLKNLNFELLLTGSGKPIEFKVDAAAGIGEGAIVGNGKISPPEKADGQVEDIGTDVQLEIQNWILQDTFKMLAARFGMPELKGTLKADLGLSGSLASGIKIDGGSTVTGLEMIDPTNTVAFGDLVLNLDANLRGAALQLNQLKVESDFCQVDAGGAFGGSDGTFDVKGDMNLDKVTLLVGEFGLMPEGMLLGGNLILNSSGATEQGKILIRKFTADFTDFRFQNEKKVFAEKSLSVSGVGEAHLEARTAVVSNLLLTAAFGRVKVSSLSLDDWNKVPAGLKMDGGADIDLAKLLKQAADFVELPEKATVTGALTAKLNLEMPQPDRQLVRLNVGLRGLKVDGPDWPKLDEDQVRLMTDLDLGENMAKVVINKINLESSALSLEGQGAFSTTGDQNSLQADGAITYALERILDYFQEQVGMDMVLKGKHRKPFKLKSQWAGADWQEALRNAEMDTDLQADLLGFFGLEVTHVDVPFKAKAGNVSIGLTADLHGGHLAIEPSVDFNQEKQKIVLSAGSKLISGVELGDGMADGLLARIHPIFRKASISQGRLEELRMDHFEWPVDQKDRSTAKFNGELRFNDLKLVASSPLLNALFEVAKINEREVTIDEKGFTFKCENDRISTSDLKIGLKDGDLVMGGSMGLDGTLNYYVDVPLSRKIIKELPGELDGQSVRIPIGGTMDKPKVDGKELVKHIGKAAVNILLDKAAKELGLSPKKLGVGSGEDPLKKLEEKTGIKLGEDPLKKLEEKTGIKLGEDPLKKLEDKTGIKLDKNAKDLLKGLEKLF